MICFYIKNRQCIPNMSVLNQHVPATIVARNPDVDREFRKSSPLAEVIQLDRQSRHFDDVHAPGRELEILMRAEVVVMGVADERVIQHCHGKKVMVFHGTFRYITAECADKLDGFDAVWLSSPRQERMILHHRKQARFQPVLIGYLPFLEFKDKTAETQRAIKEKLGVHGARPIAIYLPARRNFGSWCGEALAMARQVPDGIELILRPHPNQLTHPTNEEISLLHELEQIGSRRENIHLDHGDYPYSELLCIADLVISDATSPAEESLYYDAAQLFTRSNPAEALRRVCGEGGMPEPEIEMLLKLYDCGIDTDRRQFDHWGRAIETALAEKDRFAAARRDYFANAFGDFSNAVIVSRLKDAVARVTGS